MKNSSINARIKAVRKELRYKQAEFGEMIGLKDSAVSRMEQDGIPITEQSIMLICQKFHVRRDWLVNGNGEMFYTGESGIFTEFVKEFQLSPVEQEIVKFVATLSADDRHKLLDLLRGLAEAIQAGHQKESTPALETEKKDLPESINTFRKIRA